MSQLFSVIDIETTGGMSRSEKITEIAVFVTDGYKIVDEFSSLVNPEKRVPPFITSLTGITNEMLEDAPKFYEIAQKIVEITRDTVFVAHNASFDYGFVKQEFAQLGYNFRLNTLCTLKLSRKLFPGHRSYSLGNICNDLNINIVNRHRAAGDAKATAILFNKIFDFDLRNNEGININGFSINGLNAKLNLTKIKNLPEKCGVYYLYNEENELIYIGKSKNIYSRVMSHLRNEKTRKGLNMRSEIADIDYELTGCELIALLKESHEIKQNKPKYNKAQRRTMNNWGIFSAENEKGYLCFYIKDINESEDICLNVYSSRNAAIEALQFYCSKYTLCQKLCGLYTSAGACFYYGLGECKGACCDAEPADEYNLRATQFIDELSMNLKDSYIIFEHCDNNQIGIVSIRQNKYSGFGFIDKELGLSPDNVDDIIKKCPENKDVKQIIRTYLNTKKDYRILKLGRI
ncbi:MAG: exonuclease domain-containing protein [Candidatus Cloacimonetes bacterium]|nr:exonuclease domain-containing protein [Candidatus Cloacimonadota bacterium]